jgi:hypothetical protein
VYIWRTIYIYIDLGCEDGKDSRPQLPQSLLKITAFGIAVESFISLNFKMKLPILLAAIAYLLGITFASPIEESDLEARQDTSGNYALAIGGARFDMSELQSHNLFYANTSAYIGQIKYQIYSEPLIVSGASPNSDSILFQSIHANPTGWQNMYLVPRQSKPIGFSTPHGSAPAGTRTTGFGFNRFGSLVNRGNNLFYACQNDQLKALHAYQIWWLAGPRPAGWTCKGPIHIHAADGCARGF